MKGRRSPPAPSRVPIWQLSVKTSRKAEEAVSELLQSIFSEAVASYFDCESNLSTCTTYSAARPGRDSIAQLKSSVRELGRFGLNPSPGTISLKRIPYKSWAESWKRHFKPIHLAGKVLIKPSWSRVAARKGESVIVLDPRLSFGTGQHPTTGFCLRELARAQRSNTAQSLLDLGTGSGILAITAAKLGYKPIDALDIDPESVRVATSNAARNRVSNRLKIVQVDLRNLPAKSKRTYSIICANLMADLLIASRKIILSRLTPGGRLIVAGILSREFDLVCRAFGRENMKLIASRSEKEWQSGTFVEKSPARI
jgi:ribosomal protein L11 methyltransferase